MYMYSWKPNGEMNVYKVGYLFNRLGEAILLGTVYSNNIMSASTTNYLQNITDDMNHILNTIGLTGTKITQTLQGSIWRVSNKKSSLLNTPETAILKITSQHLHQQSTATVCGKKYKVDENIITEQNILKYLTQQIDCPDTIVKYQWFFQNKRHLFLLMTDGGNSLVDFCAKSHQLVRNGIIDSNHWKEITKIIFKQMVECIDYIHSKHVCHFDISLENFVINDDTMRVYIPGNGTLRFALDTIKVKLCDFGLSEIFGTDYSSNKWCGKQQYMSPELVSKKTFHAMRNDIWCLGMCLFLLNFGTAPWDLASNKSSTYRYVMSHSVGDLLKHWNVKHLYDEDLVCCMNSMIKFEGNRANLKDIKQYIKQHMM
eukprot:177240_1